MREKELGIKGWLSGPARKGSEQVAAEKESQPVALDKRRIVVLPLANISPSPADEYFADGLTEELISAVSNIRELRAISRTSAMRYKGTSKSVGEIARELNVGTVLEGSVRKAGNKLRINMQLIDAERDEPLCSESYERELQDIFAIQSDIATCIAKALQIHLLRPEKLRLERKATSNTEAYTLYLKGLHYRGAQTEEGYSNAVRCFEEALQKDPNFADVFAGLAECYERMGEDGILPPKESFPKAREYALKAIELDDSLAEAHSALGAVFQEYYYDQSGAEREFERAISLNPSFGRVCQSYGAHLACMGRIDEAITEIGRAQSLNPLALDVNQCAAVVFNSAGQPDKSVEVCEKMLQIDENHYPVYSLLAEAYLEQSRFDEAIDVLQKAVAISNGAALVKSRLGFAYARAGKTRDAEEILRGLEKESKEKYVSPLAFAMVHCGLGEKDEALNWLEKACEERAGGIVVVKVRPIWSSLRSEPRFAKLVNKMGLNV